MSEGDEGASSGATWITSSTSLASISCVASGPLRPDRMACPPIESPEDSLEKLSHRGTRTQCAHAAKLIAIPARADLFSASGRRHSPTGWRDLLLPSFHADRRRSGYGGGGGEMDRGDPAPLSTLRARDRRGLRSLPLGGARSKGRPPPRARPLAAGPRVARTVARCHPDALRAGGRRRSAHLPAPGS